MHVAACLGRPPGPGGRHAAMGTHNRLIGLADGSYLEAIAIDSAAPAPSRPRWFDLDRFEGEPRLTNWIARVDDLDAAVAAFPEAGRIMELARGDLRWRMAVREDGRLPYDGAFPALIEWRTDPPTLAPTDLSLIRLELQHPEADGLRAALARLIEDPRIEVVAGPARLTAEFDTDDGRRTLR